MKVINLLIAPVLTLLLSACANSSEQVSSEQVVNSLNPNKALILLKAYGEEKYEREQYLLEKMLSNNPASKKLYKKTYVVHAVFEGMTPGSDAIVKLGCLDIRFCSVSGAMRNINPGVYRLEKFLIGGHMGTQRVYNSKECGDIIFEAKKGDIIFLGGMVPDKYARNFFGQEVVSTPKFINIPVDNTFIAGVSAQLDSGDMISSEEVKIILPKPINQELYNDCKG